MVVSDDASWPREVVPALEREGYLVRTEPVERVLGLAPAPCDVALVDLPASLDRAASVVSALQVARCACLVVVASSALGEASALAFYDTGVDLVVHRPVRPREVVARVRALLRRSPPAAQRVPEHPDAPVTVDRTTCVAMVDGRKTALTLSEADVLQVLVSRRGAVATREELSAGIAAEADPEGSLDAVIRRLRGKLEALEGRRRIVAVRGVGFRLLPDP